MATFYAIFDIIKTMDKAEFHASIKYYFLINKADFNGGVGAYGHQ